MVLHHGARQGDRSRELRARGRVRRRRSRSPPAPGAAASSASVARSEPTLPGGRSRELEAGPSAAYREDRLRPGARPAGPGAGRPARRRLRPPRRQADQRARDRRGARGAARLRAGPREQRPRRRFTGAGTPEYMAPEQVAHAPVTAAADWYAFGVMLFELLTGGCRSGGCPHEILYRKQHGRRPGPPTLAPAGAARSRRAVRRAARARPEPAPRGRRGAGQRSPRRRRADQAPAPPALEASRVAGRFVGRFVGREAELDASGGAARRGPRRRGRAGRDRARRVGRREVDARAGVPRAASPPTTAPRPAHRPLLRARAGAVQGGRRHRRRADAGAAPLRRRDDRAHDAGAGGGVAAGVPGVGARSGPSQRRRSDWAGLDPRQVRAADVRGLARALARARRAGARRRLHRRPAVGRRRLAGPAVRGSPPPRLPAPAPARHAAQRLRGDAAGRPAAGGRGAGDPPAARQPRGRCRAGAGPRALALGRGRQSRDGRRRHRPRVGRAPAVPARAGPHRASQTGGPRRG